MGSPASDRYAWKACAVVRPRMGGSPQRAAGSTEPIPQESVHSSQLTDRGRRIGVLFTMTAGRVLAPGLVAFDLALPDELAKRSPLATSWRNLTVSSAGTSTKGWRRPEGANLI